MRFNLRRSKSINLFPFFIILIPVGPLSFESSHQLFRGAFSDGVFPWEVLKVLSGPPHVVFTWRHWGKFEGRVIEFYLRGVSSVSVSLYFSAANLQCSQRQSPECPNISFSRFSFFFLMHLFRCRPKHLL